MAPSNISSHPAIQPSSHPDIQPSSHPAIQPKKLKLKPIEKYINLMPESSYSFNMAQSTTDITTYQVVSKSYHEFPKQLNTQDFVDSVNEYCALGYVATGGVAVTFEYNIVTITQALKKSNDEKPQHEYEQYELAFFDTLSVPDKQTPFTNLVNKYCVAQYKPKGGINVVSCGYDRCFMAQALVKPYCLTYTEYSDNTN